MHNRDKSRKKMLDLRKAYLSGQRPHLRKLFGKLHPDLKSSSHWFFRQDKTWWYHCRNLCFEWYRQVTGCHIPASECHPPASYRRIYNQKRRRSEQREIDRAMRTGDWEEILPCRHRSVRREWDLDWY